MEFRDGDVFRWSYKDHVKVLGDDCGLRYHCKSCIAIFHDGFLGDTFWGRDRRALNLDSVDLTFVANLNDFESRPYADLSEYERSDTMDLRHSNCSSRSLKFVKIGAEKSRALVLKNAQEALVKAQIEHASAYRSVRWAREKLAALIADT